MQSLLLDGFTRDVRYAVRRLVREPRFTLTALVTLALCLGANLTIFAVVDSVLLRPLPFPAADRLVTIFNTYPNAGVDRDGASVTNYYERRGRLAAFADLAIFRHGTAIVGEAGATEPEEITRVSPDFFSTLGIVPVMGRAFTDEEMTRQTDGVAVLTDAHWRQRLNADSNVLGHPGNVLQFESRGGTSSRAAQRLRHGFLVAQIALAFVLLTGAGLLGLSLQRAMATSPGFRADHVLTGHITLPRSTYQSTGVLLAFADRLLDALDRQPRRPPLRCLTALMQLSGSGGVP